MKPLKKKPCYFCRRHYSFVKKHENYHCPQNPDRKKQSQAGSHELCKQCPNLNLNLFERHRIKKPTLLNNKLLKSLTKTIKIQEEKTKKEPESKNNSSIMEKYFPQGPLTTSFNDNEDLPNFMLETDNCSLLEKTSNLQNENYWD